MNARDIALTGIPRGGTTLACRLLGRCEGTAALFEPMDVMALPTGDRAAAVQAVRAFFDDCRDRWATSGRLPSKQRDGQVPDNPFGARDAEGRRAALADPGWIQVPPRPAGDGTLVVKHNAAFAALLPELAASFETLAIVRNPAAVLASWYSVPLPVSTGRVPAGERLDPALASRLDAAPGVVARQLHLLDWFYGRFATHLPPDRVLRYEDVVASGGALLAGRLGLPQPEPLPLSSRNANPLYESPALRDALGALASTEGRWQRWYSRVDVDSAAARIATGTP